LPLPLSGVGHDHRRFAPDHFIAVSRLPLPMKNLHFIRSITVMEDDDYYESKTDVCVFGDLGGYAYLCDVLREARDGGGAIKLSEIPRRSNSMHVVILPAATHPLRAPRLKLIERIVFARRAPVMELIVYGNRAGYNKLGALVAELADSRAGVPLDHFHVDDWTDDWVVKRSVALNIRGPLKTWSRHALGSYATAIYERSRHYIPDDIGYLHPRPYEFPDPRDGTFLSLRRA
jgi:hypothetical protein